MPTTDGARRTRDRILDVALELFNERGSSAVTTNHVAARAGISPGNLYYWFSDKDEIVRELYARYVAAYERVWAAGNSDASDQGDSRDLTPDEVLARLADGAAIARQYSFLARDLLGLLHGDPMLTAQYRGVRERRITAFTDLAHSWRARGLLGPVDDETVDDLVQALWIIAETWLAFGELDGSRRYVWTTASMADIGIVRHRFGASVNDVALAAVTAGADFADRAGSLGEATAQVHATLAQTMGTREATDDDIAALTASMRARHAAALAEVPALAAHESLVQASIEAVSSASWPALQRIHGDFHLGQVLHAPGRGWVLVDFEGEPLRPLVERTQPDLALRDVAGMLRSFDYVAGSWEQAHPGPPGSGMIDPQAWADRARTAFLDGYTAGAGRDPRDDAVLLNALELDKALYEVVYEARNRPTWLGIPTTAVARIARTAQLSAGRRSDLRS